MTGIQKAEHDSAIYFIHSLQRVVTQSFKVQSEVVDMIVKDVNTKW